MFSNTSGGLYNLSLSSLAFVSLVLLLNQDTAEQGKTYLFCSMPSCFESIHVRYLWAMCLDQLFWLSVSYDKKCRNRQVTNQPRRFFKLP